MNFNKKLKIIRSLKGYTQSYMSEILDINIRSLQRFEIGEQEPRYKVIGKLCKEFPQYTLWLMTDDITTKQIKPTVRGPE